MNSLRITIAIVCLSAALVSCSGSTIDDGDAAALLEDPAGVIYVTDDLRDATFDADGALLFVSRDGEGEVLKVGPAFLSGLGGDAGTVCAWTDDGLTRVDGDRVTRLKVDRADAYSYFSGLRAEDRACVSVDDLGFVEGDPQWSVAVQEKTGIRTVSGGTGTPDSVVMDGDRLLVLSSDVRHERDAWISEVDLVRPDAAVSVLVKFKWFRSQRGSSRRYDLLSRFGPLLRGTRVYWVARYGLSGGRGEGQYRLDSVSLKTGAFGSKHLETLSKQRVPMERAFLPGVSDGSGLFYPRADGSVRRVDVINGVVVTVAELPETVTASTWCTHGSWTPPRLTTVCLGNVWWSVDLATGEQLEGVDLSDVDWPGMPLGMIDLRPIPR